MEDKTEKLEDQFILRLPVEKADKLKKLLQTKPKKVKKHVFLTVDPENRAGEIIVKNDAIPLKLIDLPTIVESYKTVGKQTMFKTADVCQMLVPDEEKENNNNPDDKKPSKDHLWPHGLTPPLKNVRKTRFRKSIKNKNNEMEPSDIVKEIKWLLKQDNEAVAIRWELVEDDQNKCAMKSSDQEVEKEIFGDVISDSENDTSDN